MEENPSQFNKELRALAGRLRMRRVVRGLTWGALFGVCVGFGLILWLWIEEARYLSLAEWSGFEPAESTLNWLLLCVPLGIGLLIGGVIGRLGKIDQDAAVQWADHSQDSPNAAAAFMEFKDTSFGPAIQKRAVEVAASARLSAYSSIRLGYRSLIATILVIACAVCIIAKPAVTNPDFFAKDYPDEPLMDRLENLGRNLLANEIAKNLEGVNAEELAEAYERMEEVKKALEEGRMTQSEALAEIKDFQSKISNGQLEDEPAELLRRFSEDQGAVENFKNLAERMQGSPDSPLGGPDVEELLRSFGGNLENPEQALESLLRSQSQEAERLRQGDAKGARTILKARQNAAEEAESLRKRVVNPNAKPDAVNQSTKHRLLLKDLKELDASKSDKSKAKRDVVRVKRATDVNQVRREEDFNSRPNKLPPHLARSAKRYFGKD